MEEAPFREVEPKECGFRQLKCDLSTKDVEFQAAKMVILPTRYGAINQTGSLFQIKTSSTDSHLGGWILQL